MDSARPKVTVLYHYLHPDDVVSARHFDGFCEDLHAHGWNVEARPCTRGCRDESKSYPLREVWDGIELNRVWRPRWRQSSIMGRILNALWMIGAWSMLALRSRARLPDVVVVGTDPIFSVMVASFIKRLRPRVKIAHWCYDLYPEAAVADDKLRPGTRLMRLFRWMLRDAYRHCDLLADLGGCMRRLLDQYAPKCRQITLVPWALSEPPAVLPPDAATRRELFGEGASLGLFYSGNFGRAHEYKEFLELARGLRDTKIRMCFSVRGNRADELRAAVKPDDRNIRFAGFAAESGLAARLSAADIHLVSLRPHWTGVVVPSKFFGCLAAGRPILFLGERESCIAHWIDEFKVGWILDAGNVKEIDAQLRALQTQPEELAALQQRCFKTYHEHFSRKIIMRKWDEQLRELLPAGSPVKPAVSQ